MDKLKEKIGIEQDKPIPADFSIPYFVHQEDMFHCQVNAKRWFIAWLITFALFVLTNIGWIVYENQFADVVTESYSAETDDGGTAIANGSGSVTYGESDLHKDNTKN